MKCNIMYEMVNGFIWLLYSYLQTQPAKKTCTCLQLKIKTLEKDFRSAHSNQQTSERRYWCLYIVTFEQI